MSRASISKKIRDQVKLKYDGHCAYCGEKPEKLVIDHLHPVIYSHRYAGDINGIDNLMPSCASCNNYKTCYDLEQFRAGISSQIYQARKNSVDFRLAERYKQLKVTETPTLFHFEKVK